MRSFDMDGVVTAGCIPSEGDIIVTGRLYTGFAQCYRECRELGVPESVPIYMRPFGADITDINEARRAAGEWKAKLLGVTLAEEHWEDDPVQIQIIRQRLPSLKVVHVTGGGMFWPTPTP